MMPEPLFRGVCTALVTPFRRGAVDFDALRRLIARQLDAGVTALLAAGTTGEASTLTDAEWELVVACTVEAARGRAVVLAGTGTNDLRRTLRRARQAEALGVHAQLVVTPYYNKTTQRGMIDYYTRITEGCGLPLMLYNVPGRTGLELLPETAARLAAHPRVIGIKEAGGSLNRLYALVQTGALPVYCGSDGLNAAALGLGAAGVISVAANVCPEAVTALWKAGYPAANGRQKALDPLIGALFAEVSPAPVKAALAMLGLCGEEVRSPLVTVEPETRRRLQAALAQAVGA